MGLTNRERLFLDCIEVAIRINGVLAHPLMFWQTHVAGQKSHGLYSLPNPASLATVNGLFVEMVCGREETPRTMITPWGDWSCFDPNIRINSHGLRMLSGAGVDLDQASEPIHDQQNQRIYQVRALHMRLLPISKLMSFDELYQPQGIEQRLKEWLFLTNKFATPVAKYYEEQYKLEVPTS